MKLRFMLLLGGLVLLCAGLAMASTVITSTGSTCTGDFSVGTGVCNILEEPTGGEQQDFNLGTPFVVTGFVDIYDANGTLSDSLYAYLNADGNVHLLFGSEGFALAGGVNGGTEDALGHWSYDCGINNCYMGVSPEGAVGAVPSLLP